MFLLCNSCHTTDYFWNKKDKHSGYSSHDHLLFFISYRSGKKSCNNLSQDIIYIYLYSTKHIL